MTHWHLINLNYRTDIPIIFAFSMSPLDQTVAHKSNRQSDSFFLEICMDANNFLSQGQNKDR